MAALTPGVRYWVPHPEQAFWPASFQAVKDGKAIFDDSGTEVSCLAAEAVDLGRVVDSQLDGVDNVCDLEDVTSAAVLHTVKTRYMKEPAQVYTRVARIMIAVNPFKGLPHLYNADVMRTYLDSSNAMDLKPHLYAIGSDAVLGLTKGGSKNQAVLISGESGAGKTESTKIVLKYVSEALSSGSGGIQDKIMRTNPVLESFGNAMTVRNNNSSRFGKWLQLAISSHSGRPCIQGCSVVDYLLELTRVVKQGEQERGYHVFFQMITAADEFKGTIKILPASEYRYVKDSQHKAPNVNDVEFFGELRDAFDALKFSSETQMEIFKMVVGILTLGNAEFVEAGDVCQPKSEGPIEDAAELFGLNPATLRKMLLVRLLKVGKDVTEAGRTVVQAEQTRDGLSRLIYGRLFKYLIKYINEGLAEGAKEDSQYFGVLDIAGFESFGKNSIEQLFINLSNEHLQAHFNNHIFKMELDDYAAEGVEVAGGLTYKDNSDIIALIDSKVSILATLDEEISVPKATDQTFEAKVIKNFDKHPRLLKPKFAGEGWFGVHHFAGEVKYEIAGFLEKNVDKPPDESADAFQESSFGVLKTIGEGIAAELAEATGGGPGKKKAKTVASSFRASLAQLIEKLNKAEPHFIRCIKPNQEKVPSKFTPPIVMEQLNCSGVFEAVRIRQSGFASRVPFEDFIPRYKPILSKPQQKAVRDADTAGKSKSEISSLMLSYLPPHLDNVGTYVAGDMCIGKTKVFCRGRALTLLDKARDYSIVGYVLDIQRVWRGYRDRKLVKQCKEIFKGLLEWLAAVPGLYSGEGLEHTALHTFKGPEAVEQQIAKVKEMHGKAQGLRLVFAKNEAILLAVAKMEKELAVSRQLGPLLSSVEPLEIGRLVTRARELQLGGLPEVAELEKRVETLRLQLPLIEAMQKFLTEGGADFDDLDELLQEITGKGLLEADGWIKELGGGDLVAKLKEAHAVAKAEKERLEAERKRERERLEAEAKAAEAKAAEAKLAVEKKAAKPALSPRGDGGEVAKRVTISGDVETRTSKEVDEAAAAKAGAAKGMDDVGKYREKLAEHDAEDAKQKKAKAEAKKRKSTITGLSEQDQSSILLELMKAVESFDLVLLQAALDKSIKQGVQESDITSDAHALFANMEKEEFLIQKMQEVQELVQSKCGDQSRNLKSLQNLIAQAVKLSVASKQVEESRKVLQEQIRLRARHTIKGTVFAEIDCEELELIDEAFSDLAKFEMLKSPATWRGHKAEWIFGFGESGDAVMLKHNKNPLKDALTKVGQAKEAKACGLFIKVLSVMGDKAESELARASLQSEIVETSIEDATLGDEVYVQLMKQLTDNPQPRSVSRGWKLMLSLCQTAMPTETLHEFVHVFCMKALKDVSTENKSLIEQCISALNSTVKRRGSEGESRSSSGPSQVLLMDQSHRYVHHQDNTTCQQAATMVCDQLQIADSNEWVLNLVTEGFNVQRLIPREATLGQMQTKTQAIKKQTGKSSWFVFKRLALKRDETLDVSRPYHATLTYCQAQRDYMMSRLMASHSERFLCLDIAAKMLYLEREHFQEHLENKNISSKEVLDQLIPPVEQQRLPANFDVGAEVLKRFQEFADSLDKRETRIVTMNRIFKLFQRTPLFGCYWWEGSLGEKPADKNNETISDDRFKSAYKSWHKKAKGDAPKGDPEVRDIEPKRDVVLAINFKELVVYDKSNDGTVLYRFAFADGAEERVVVWGGRGPVMQCLCLCKDVCKDGTYKIVPKRLNFQHVGATDAAYALDTLYKNAGWRT